VEIVAERLGIPDSALDFRNELTALDREYRAGLERCERRTLVTAHDAFGRLAGRYDLEVIPIAGVDPEQEPNPKKIAELADVVKRFGVRTIFTEELVAPDVAETLAREAGGLRTETLNPLEGLSDQERDAGADYFTVMRDTLAKLRVALGCRAAA
jgi:zinc transport system substrate-binding protein